MPTFDDALTKARAALALLKTINYEIVPTRSSAVFDARDALNDAVQTIEYLVRKLETAKSQERAMAKAK